MWYPGASLYYRKRLAASFYWLGWRLVRLADKIDGKQPRKRKHAEDCRGMHVRYATIPPKDGYSGCTCGAGDK